MNPVSDRHACPSCGGPLATGTLVGVCPSCAWSDLAGGEAEADLKAGDVHGPSIEGHEILAEIARGGGGIVYHAQQLAPLRDVALKVLPPHLLTSAEMRARFRAEAETVAGLDHPGILPVFVAGEQDGMPFFTMKLAAGGTLAARRESLKGSWRAIAAVVADVADAVQFAHEHGVIHRDLKPGNILFDEMDRPYVSDFGLAKFTAGAAGVTQPQAVLGTPAYLAPEAAERGAAAATAPADIYSLGAILYELLCGRPPFVADSLVSLLRQIAVQAPERPRAVDSNVPTDLEVICLRAMAKEPASRFRTAGALADDLRRWLDRRPIDSRPVSALERGWSWARRNPALAALSTALGVALVVGGIVLTQSNRQLRAALGATRVAQSEAQEQLRSALLSDGRLRRQSGMQGQRYDALAVLERAARIQAGTDLRGEIAGALAQPDLRLERRLPTDFLAELTVVAFAPDLSAYLDLAPDGGFALRRCTDGSEIRRFQTAGPGNPDNFSFSADGRRVRVSFRRGNSEVWDIDSGTRLWSGGRGVVALYPDVPVIAVAGEGGDLRVIDLRDGSETPLAMNDRVVALSFDPEGGRLAAVTEGACVLYATGSAKEIARIGVPGNATTPAWSPDGRRLAVGGAPGYSVHVIDVAEARVVQTLRNFTARLVGLQFHPDNRRVITLARDNTLRIWDGLSGGELLRASMAPRALAVSTDGRRLGAAVSEKELGLFELAPSEVLREFLGRNFSGRQAHTCAVSPDNRWLATCDPEEIRVWDVERGVEVAAFAFADDDLTSVHFAPDRSALLYSGTSRGLYRRTMHVDAAIDTIGFGPEEEVGANRDGRLMGFARDGRDWFIDREAAGHVVIWPDGDSGRERVGASSGHSERPEFSPDGKWVVTMGYRQVKVQLWSTIDASVSGLVPVRRHSGAEFSPDGRWLLTSNMEEFRLWSLPDLHPSHGWPTLGHGGLGWGATAFSPDGTIVACEQAGEAIAIFDVRTGEQRITLPPATASGLSHLSWSRDGRRLFLYYDDQRVFCWEFAALRRELAARGLDW